jgi:hypothetical protein
MPPPAPRRQAAPPVRAARPAAPLVKANGQFNRSQHRVLRSLAMWKALGHENPSREMVAAASGYSPSSGGFNNLLGSLATAGAIGKPMPGHLNLLMAVDEMSRRGRPRNAARLSEQPAAQVGGCLERRWRHVAGRISGAPHRIFAIERRLQQSDRLAIDARA